ncbi:MAG: HlyD family efflux transporter periplasmic adaptor subunit [Planctomycetaceae bacterium]|nr:HlyD family efflux transporter periplasmic adaptor subunit [Planctomycetaceae bacterium]
MLPRSRLALTRNLDNSPPNGYTFGMVLKKRVRSILIRCAISLVLLAVTGLLISRMIIPEEIPHVADSGVVLTTVEVVPIRQHDTGIDFSVDGEVVPRLRIDLVAEVQGRVIYKSEQCRLGKYVEKDEILLEIDPVDYQLTVDQAETAVSQAKVNIDENEVQKTNVEKELALAQERLTLTRRDYERYQQLVQRNSATQADLENVQNSVLAIQEVLQQRENQYRVLNTQTERLNVLLRREELALETAQLNRDRTKIKAPISGIITEDSFEVNSFIQKGANVARILDTSQLEIQSSLHMRQIQWIWRQSGESTGYVFAPTPVTIVYEMDGERWAWDGELKTLDGGIMNPITRMVPCRVRVDNPQAGRYLAGTPRTPPTLFAGMFVTVIVHSKPEIPLYRIPERALLPGNRIWTVVDGTLRQHSIRLATTTPEGVLFYADSAAIRPNDLVVVSPLASPTEGSAVQIIQHLAGTPARF